MKLILFFLFMFSYTVQAESLSYKTIEMSATPIGVAEQFGLIFNQLGYHSLAEDQHGIPSLGINQVYFKDADLFVMVKYGVEGKFPLDEIIHTPNGFMVHKKEKNQVFMMYFQGLEIEGVKFLLNKLTQKVSNYKVLQNFLIPSAQASDCTGATGAPILNQSGQLSGISAAAAWNSLKSCMTGVGEGVADSTVGVVTGIADELWAFAKSPIDYTTAVAKKVQTFLTKTATFIKQLVTNPNEAFANVGKGIENTWTSVKQTVTSMSTQMKINFVCNFIGAIGVDAAIAFFTGGAGSGKIALTMAKLAKKFEMVAKVMKLLSKLNSTLLSKLQLSGHKLEKFMKGLFNGKIPDGDLIHLNEMAHMDGDFSLRTLSCYLR